MTSIPPRGVRVLLVSEDPAVCALAERVLARRGDTLIVAHSVEDGVERGVELAVDVAFVDVSEQQRMGLTLVHALRTASARTSIHALTTKHAVDAGAQALSLGADGVVLVPPTGDELLLAVDRARERSALDDLNASLRSEVAALRLAVAEAARLASLKSPSFVGVVRGLVGAVSSATSSTRVGAYTRSEGVGYRLLVSTDDAGFPSTCEDEDALDAAAQQTNALVIPVPGTNVCLFAATPAPAPRDPGLELLVVLAARLFSMVKDREALSDGAMKDPSSSAYSFGYFVDVAGREIDKAQRYGRRFALVSLTIDAGAALSPLEVAERVLEAARDIDILARVDESELLLLTPEADGLEVSELRQRIVRALSGTSSASGNLGPSSVRAPFGVTVGTSVFPHDGADLTQLLRVARRRAEATRVSVVERLKLDVSSLPQVIEALLADGDLAQGRGPRSPESGRAIELPIAEVVSLVSSAVSYARRGGPAVATVTQRDELGLSAALRLADEGKGFEVRAHDVRDRPGCAKVEAFALVAEHGSYALLGLLEEGIFRGVHAADPMLAELTAAMIADARRHEPRHEPPGWRNA